MHAYHRPIARTTLDQPSVWPWCERFKGADVALLDTVAQISERCDRRLARRRINARHIVWTDHGVANRDRDASWRRRSGHGRRWWRLLAGDRRWRYV
jgi:hypothetical protein